jgi:decaprenylphospho-beta-D-ribofuranose 2-oxidase
MSPEPLAPTAPQSSTGGGAAAGAGAGERLVRAARPTLLCGWGRTAPSSAQLVHARDASDVESVLASDAARCRGVIARGAGRSYGDAAQNADGLVLDVTALRSIERIEGERTTLRVGAGTTLVELMSFLMPRGLTLPVTPGTKFITVGGAIAGDIHGKNHHRDGSFGHHVLSLTLCTPGGERLEVSRKHDPDLFFATLGGMGLTGVVVDAVIATEPLPSTTLLADVDRTEDVEEALALLCEETRRRYAIAWLDMLSGWPRDASARLGRAVIARSDYAPSATAREPIPLRERPRLVAPRGFPGAVLNPLTVRAFNALRWHMAPTVAHEEPHDINDHFFPLDAIGQWSRLYGRGGLVQYQFAVPVGEAASVVRVLEGLRHAHVPMYLVVIKRFGAPSGGLLSFPFDSLAVAIDVPARTRGLHAALEHADRQVIEASGRVYLAKDSRLSGDSLAAMYPQLGRFNELRARVDPDAVLRSDMALRLGLASTERSARA